MQSMYYIGLDVHKKTITYCVKDVSGSIHAEGSIHATRSDLDRWMKTLPQPWTAAMEATVFTGGIHDHLKPHAAALKVAHPLILRAFAAAKKKNDHIDAKRSVIVITSEENLSKHNTRSLACSPRTPCKMLVNGLHRNNRCIAGSGVSRMRV